MNKRLVSILRYLYEYGFITDNILNRAFYSRDDSKRGPRNKEDQIKNENCNLEEKEHENGGGLEAVILTENEAGRTKKDKEYETNRAYNIRVSLRPLIDEGFIDIYRVGDRHLVGVRDTYFLTIRGYKFVSENLMDMEHLAVDSWGRGNEDRVIISNLDKITQYRYFPKRDFKAMELKHNEYLLYLKMALSYVVKNRIILPELIHKDDPIFTTDKLDILLEEEEDKFIGFEYERSLKSRDKYLGYVKWQDGRKIHSPGFFRKRQDDEKLLKIIVVCETDSILKALLHFISLIQTPDDRGNYKILNKFYLISRENFKTIKEMFLNGTAIHPRGRVGMRKDDYDSIPFLDLLSN